MHEYGSSCKEKITTVEVEKPQKVGGVAQAANNGGGVGDKSVFWNKASYLSNCPLVRDV